MNKDIKSKNSLSINSFYKYCIKHPEQRFFQALTNWFGFDKIGVYDGKKWIDLWNMEENKDYQINK